MTRERESTGINEVLSASDLNASHGGRNAKGILGADGLRGLLDDGCNRAGGGADV
jgi:hypothetical protein